MKKKLSLDIHSMPHVFVNHSKGILLLPPQMIYFVLILVTLLCILFIYLVFLLIQTLVTTHIIGNIVEFFLLLPPIIILSFLSLLYLLMTYKFQLHLHLEIWLLVGWVHHHRSLLVLLFIISLFLITVLNPHLSILRQIGRSIPRPSHLNPHIALIRMIVICIGLFLLHRLRRLALFTLYQRLYLL